MNSQTAGKCAAVFPNRIICSSLSIYPLLPFPPHHSRHAQSGNKALNLKSSASLLPLFHLQTRGSQLDCRREKPSPSQHGCCFRAARICCMHRDFLRSHWAIHRTVVDTELFAFLSCSPPVALQQKERNVEQSFSPTPFEETLKIHSVTLSAAISVRSTQI